MNGQLSENHLSELIRELSLKNLSGKLSLQRDKVTAAVYFQSGALKYAACNVRTLRLNTYLIEHKFVSEEVLRYLGAKTKDFDLLRTLTSEHRISATQAKQLQAKQVSDVLRLVLLWTEGTWEFDNRSQLDEEVTFQIDVPRLIMECSRRLPPKFTANRFRNSSEIFSPALEPPEIDYLLPTEVFLLSRVDGPMSLSEVLALSGQSEAETLQVLYSLLLANLLTREHWNNAFRDAPAKTATPLTKAAPPPSPPVGPSPAVEVVDTVDSFLERVALAQSHYEVLNIGLNATLPELKTAYYNLARKYHPDRFRSSGDSVLASVETAFARITQAYDTLRDSGQRATYDSKLEAQRRAAKLAQSAPKAHASEPQPARNADDDSLSPNESAELQFRDGFAALEMGERNLALGLLGSAARAFPDEPRYRAYYGRALALQESTRRLAEGELLAALKLEPTNAEYRIMLAELYRDLGFTMRAKREAEHAVASDSNNRKARDLLRSLA